VRVAIISQVTPAVEGYSQILRALGHEPVGVVCVRSESRYSTLAEHVGAIAGQLDVVIPSSRERFAPLLAALEPDLALCLGFPWKLTPEMLAVPRLGVVNSHPSLLPRYRGPFPVAWAIRRGETEIGMTFHRMDAELDTGAILAQKTIPILDEETTIWEMGPRVVQASVELLPRVFERLAAGDPGEPQADEGASWAGFLEEDYATIDWSQTSREIHNQVRAWSIAFQSEPEGPFAELDGERVKVKRTSLTDPGDGSTPHETGDGQIWILETEPTT